MAALARLLYLAAIVIAALTGCAAQCRNDHYRPLRLSTSPGIYGDIYSPDYPRDYPNNEDCEWRISADPGYVVHVHVVWMDLEESMQCQYDKVTFYDGYTTTYLTIPSSPICDSLQTDFYSSGPSMVVTFESDQSISQAGFHLEYTAVRRSQVPTTTTTPPWWITTTRSTTTSSDGNTGNWKWDDHINTPALIGGLTAGLLLLVVFCALCRCYYSRAAYARRQPPRYNQYAQAPPTGQAPPSTIYQNNNAVFMVSSPHCHPSAPPPAYFNGGGGGVNNLGFNPCGEAPPAYYSAQHATGFAASFGMNGGVLDTRGLPPPPSYTEAMIVSHPPSTGYHVHNPHIPANIPPVPMSVAPPTGIGHTPLQVGAASPHISGRAPPTYAVASMTQTHTVCAPPPTALYPSSAPVSLVTNHATGELSSVLQGPLPSLNHASAPQQRSDTPPPVSS